MRASLFGQHLAGAERIVAEAEVCEVVAALTARAMGCDHGPADEIHSRVERVDPLAVRYERLPDISTCLVNDWQEGRRLACRMLLRAGVAERVADQAIELLAAGAGPDGSVMRGAVIMDAVTGVRLEPDQSRGVRVTRMDLAPEFRPVLARDLDSAGLSHHRVLEALVLAGKVLHAPGLVAELCWSDDPAYTTGYVSDPRGGYQRISPLKPAGDPFGGRIFFVNQASVSSAELVDYLEKQVVLFNASGTLTLPRKERTADE